MRRSALILALIALPAAADTLDAVESDVFPAEGISAAELAKRGKTCIAQTVRNDEVRIADSASTPGLFGFGLPPSTGNVRGVTGGDVIVDADLEAGIITANSRTEYSSMLIGYNVKSLLTLMTKDGRFKIRHTGIERLQKDSGTMANDGYGPIHKQWGTGWEAAQEALQTLSTKLADCIRANPKGGDW